MRFVPIDEHCEPTPFDPPWFETDSPLEVPWSALPDRGLKLSAIRS